MQRQQLCDQQLPKRCQHLVGELRSLADRSGQHPRNADRDLRGDQLMAITRRQFIAAGSAAGMLLSTPLVAGTTATRVELVAGERAIALEDQQQLRISQYGRQAYWHQDQGDAVSITAGSPPQTRIVAAAKDGTQLVVLDRGHRQLRWFQANGVLARELNLPDLLEPADFILYAGQAVIADVHGHRLLALDTHSERRAWLESDRPLNGPASLARTQDRLSLLTLGDQRLHHFTLAGESLGSEGSMLAMPGSLTAVNNHLLVMDRSQNQLCWADHTQPVLALPQTGPQQLTYMSWQPGSNLLISV